MNIEEKAKRYDEALGKARRYYDEYKTRDNILYVEDMEEMFPELKESEEERIRKVLINGFNKLDKSAVWYNGITNGQILAWLEKQGEQKSIDDLTQQEAMDIAVGKCFEQCEQKPVEPQQDMLSQEKYAKAVDESIYGEQKSWSEEDEDKLKRDRSNTL